ncbi:hypothetical protein Leryth_002292 [Lithospermum erythrorhizon]|nr:hypothetical protein Leryth_002292 [Lithospermum erythrorhizon]
MNDILAQVATKTETNKNAGNAILYECVATIMAIEDNGGSMKAKYQYLGRFLSNRDNNIRYVALNMLMRAIAVDSQAVQRHRATILECVKDADASIRKRALELVYVLANESNVQTLTKELTDYLVVSDLEFRGDLCEKICSMVEKFSPNKIWYIDQMLKVLSEAGNYVKDEVWHSLIVVITNALNLHGYSVRSLYKVVQTANEQETLVRVAVWCIGEYGDLLVNNTGVLDIEDPITVSESAAVDVVEIATKCHSSDPSSKAMCLIALLKLSSRFPSSSMRINEIVAQYKGSFVLELQQRAIEFDTIIQRHQNIRSTLVERMPALDEAGYSGRKTGSVPAVASTSQGTSLNLPNGAVKTTSPLVDLLDLSAEDDVPTPNLSGGDVLQDLLGIDLSPASSQSGMNQAQKSGTDVLLDLLSIETPPGQSSSSMPDMSSPTLNKKSTIDVLDILSSPSAPSTQIPSAGSSSTMDLLDSFPPRSSMPDGNGPAYPSIVAFESNTLKVTFNFSKQQGNPQTVIEAHFSNKSPNVYTDFIFQAAVPKAMLFINIFTS